MDNINISNVKISAISCALPKNKTTVEDYCSYYGEKKIKRFMKTAGVRERYIGNGMQTASDLCVCAAEEIFNKTRIKKEEIDVLIFISQTPDYKTPSTAFVIQKRLGLSKKCICFDVNMGCTSLLHGIYIAGPMISSGVAKKALVLIGDAHLVHATTDDTAETMMFGEAGSALVLEKGEKNVFMELYCDGSRFDMIMNACGERFQTLDDKPNGDVYKFYMDGGAVFNFAIETVPKSIVDFCNRRKSTLEEYDSIILHQANMFILRHIANELNIPMEKIAISIDRYGNTNGSSILVTIVDMIERKKDLPESLKLLVSAFGIGLSWGVMEIEIDTNIVLPFIYTDDFYKEGKNINYLKGE